VLIVLVAIALIAYVTLDTIYFHVFFSAESAVVGLVQSLIVIVAMVLLLFIQQREKSMQPSSSTQKKSEYFPYP